MTPVPSGRCPFEYFHEQDEDDYRDELRRDLEILRSLGHDPWVCLDCGMAKNPEEMAFRVDDMTTSVHTDDGLVLEGGPAPVGVCESCAESS